MKELEDFFEFLKQHKEELQEQTQEQQSQQQVNELQTWLKAFNSASPNQDGNAQPNPDEFFVQKLAELITKQMEGTKHDD